MERQGFYYNQTACVGCKTCQVACKDKNNLPVGILFRHVDDFECGAYPDARLYPLSLTCNHCEQPACVAACPSGAMYVKTGDGTVQHDDSLCIGCQYCVGACPYGNPKYFAEERIVRKCDACLRLRTAGEPPACAAACPMRALEFGPMSRLRKRHPDAVSKVAALPEPLTLPSMAIDAREAAFVEPFSHVRL